MDDGRRRDGRRAARPPRHWRGGRSESRRVAHCSARGAGVVGGGCMKTLTPQAAEILDGFPSALRHRLTDLRRAIHEHPELSFKEEETAARLEAALSGIPGAEVRRIGDTGVVGRIPGKSRRAPVVAVRGDIDALPIQEATNLP